MRPGSKQWIAEMQDRYENSLLGMTGYDNCIVGVCIRFGQPPILCYDVEKVIRSLMKDMPREEAEEFFDFNQLGAWMGESTPAFLIR